MYTHIIALLCIVAVAAASSSAPLDITDKGVSVSGLSAGAYFAVQYSVAFSDQVIGSGIVAGGPYYCAQDSVTTGLTACMSVPLMISTSTLESSLSTFASDGKIDDPKNLKNHRMYIYSGTQDTVINQGVAQKLESMMETYIPDGNIQTNFDTDSEHGFPTLDYGVSCTTLGSPFILNCGIDVAGDILQWVFNDSLVAPANSSYLGTIYTFNQEPYLPAGTSLSGASLGDIGALYVPPHCANGANKCVLHIVFHGCEQTYSDIGLELAQHSGFASWADANGIVLLFPMVVRKMLTNPMGCFDWWGYTNSDYAVQKGVQMATVQNMQWALINNGTLSGLTATNAKY